MAKRYNYSKRQGNAEAAVARLAVAYVRVSSKEQEEGFSIQAQKRLLESYAEREGIEIVEVFEDVETAKRAGRKSFERMMAYLQDRPDVTRVLVEKTDRLYRNFKDYVQLDDLKREVHLVKEGEVMGTDSKSHQKFIHGIKVLMAKNYIDNLSEEVQKGMLERARSGLIPTRAPVGYLNDRNLKKIVLDHETAPMVQRAFELYATGNYSLADIRKELIAMGFSRGPTGSKPPKSSIELMLKNPVYYGEFRFQGKLYKGTHPPLVSRDTFDRVQQLLAGNGPGLYQDREFAFTGFMTCAFCGCAITAEIKKGKYIYYHCTNGRGTCKPKRTHVPEKELIRQFGEVIGQLKLDEDLVGWIQEALSQSGKDEQEFHLKEVARLQNDVERLIKKRDQMYLDKLDGQVSEELWLAKSAEWTAMIEKAKIKLVAHQRADQNYQQMAAEVLELSQSAHSLFLRQTPQEQRELLNHVLSNCVLKDAQVVPEYRKPFDLIAFAATDFGQKNSASGSSDPKTELKWALLDSNQ